MSSLQSYCKTDEYIQTIFQFAQSKTAYLSSGEGFNVLPELRTTMKSMLSLNRGSKYLEHPEMILSESFCVFMAPFRFHVKSWDRVY